MKPQKFLLCFERTNAKDQKVWSIRVRGKWFHAAYVQLMGGFVETVWRGTKAAQPRAYLQGKGIIERDEETGAVYIQVER